MFGIAEHIVSVIDDPAGKRRLRCYPCRTAGDLGIPCRHQLCVNDGVWDLEDIDVHWLKITSIGYVDEDIQGITAADLALGPLYRGGENVQPGSRPLRDPRPRDDRG